jgi:hypothetical protein
LTLLSRRIDSGFSINEIEDILQMVSVLDVEKTASFKFAVQFDGVNCFLWIQVYMNDTDSPDLRVYGPARFIGEIDRASQ